MQLSRVLLLGLAKDSDGTPTPGLSYRALRDILDRYIFMLVTCEKSSKIYRE